jgi:predicted Ser/Thr protein kinase
MQCANPTSVYVSNSIIYVACADKVLVIGGSAPTVAPARAATPDIMNMMPIYAGAGVAGLALIGLALRWYLSQRTKQEFLDRCATDEDKNILQPLATLMYDYIQVKECGGTLSENLSPEYMRAFKALGLAMQEHNLPIDSVEQLMPIDRDRLYLLIVEQMKAVLLTDASFFSDQTLVAVEIENHASLIAEKIGLKYHSNSIELTVKAHSISPPGSTTISPPLSPTTSQGSVGSPVSVLEHEQKSEVMSDIFLDNVTLNPAELTFGKILGAGSFGRVYQGTWRHSEVAIKELLPECLSPVAVEEFEREAHTMQRLRSPHVIQFYGYCVSPKYCIVMEYMPQGSLFNLLHYSQKPLSWEMRIHIAQDLSKGLEYLHAEKVLHRDIKSQNVLLSENNTVKLTDFGLSKVKMETRSATKGVQSVGTLAWMAPELFARNGVYTFKADIYSLGMTLWELASRDTPFKEAPSPAMISCWVLGGEREEIPADCPQKLSNAITACWAQEPEHRPTATELTEFLYSDARDFAEILPRFRSLQKTASPTATYEGNLHSLPLPPGKKLEFKKVGI